RFTYAQPKVNDTGKLAPPTCVRFASAGNGIGVWFGGTGATENDGMVCGFSCSSNTTSASCPIGYHAGRTFGVAGHVNGPCFTFESRHVTKLVPPVKTPPLRNRPAKFVASGSRRSTAV